MESSKDQSSKSSLIDFGLLLFGLSFCSYCSLFFYIMGKYSYFKVPIELVKIDTTVLLTAGASVFGLVLQMYLFIEAVFRYSLISGRTKVKNRKSKIYLTILAVIMFWFLYSSLTGISSQFYERYIRYGSLAIMIIILCDIWFSKEDSKNASPEDTKKENESFDLDDILKPKIGFKPYRSFSYLMIICVSMYFCGLTRSMVRNDYYVINTKPEMLIVDFTENNLICKTFDRKSRTFNEKCIVLAKTNIPNNYIKNETIGKLKFVKTLEKYGPAK